tara:strand:- start:450 stop:647 length:198 start_codon:yes stop_codon:yes gene_type:complete
VEQYLLQSVQVELVDLIPLQLEVEQVVIIQYFQQLHLLEVVLVVVLLVQLYLVVLVVELLTVYTQ